MYLFAMSHREQALEETSSAWDVTPDACLFVTSEADEVICHKICSQGWAVVLKATSIILSSEVKDINHGSEKSEEPRIAMILMDGEVIMIRMRILQQFKKWLLLIKAVVSGRLMRLRMVHDQKTTRHIKKKSRRLHEDPGLEIVVSFKEGLNLTEHEPTTDKVESSNPEGKEAEEISSVDYEPLIMREVNVG
eukprot:Gb_39873 [translate_table: standard]